MASRSFSFCLLVSLSLLSLHSRADETGSVFFLDSSSNRYFRPSPSDATTDEKNKILLPEIGAAVSVLLGFAPPATLSASSSDKLNELLMPKPFDRPRAVFILEVNGAKDVRRVGMDNNVFGSALRSGVVFGQNKADIQLQDQDEVSVVSLNERLDSDAECTDKELTDFAWWLGGSYVSNAVEPLNGELTIPLENGVQLNLHMSKKADREFTTSLVSLIRNLRHAMIMHQDLSASMNNPAELLTGRFDGIKALLEQYGSDGIAQQGVELLATSLSKIFDSLQTAYKGQIVGVILFNATPQSESKTMLTVTYTSRPSPRWLEEEKTLPNSTAIIAEVLLVRTTLAWITGIILLISTLLGIYFLMYMPLTRDTLLYSNVKLD